MYASQADLAARLGADVMLALADDGTGHVDAARVTRALTDAQAEVDSYVMARHTVPLSPVPPIIAKVTLDLATYQLFMWRGFDKDKDAEVQVARDQAVDWLRRLSQGEVSIGQAEPAKDFGVSVGSEPRLFSRSKLGDF